MASTRSQEAATLLSIVLPTLAAAAEGERPLTEDEAVAACLEIEQRAVRCSGELAASQAVNLPLGARVSEAAIAESSEEGTGAASLRKEWCRKHIRYKTFTRADRAQASKCGSNNDCPAFVACARPVFDKLIAPPKVSFERAQAAAARTEAGGIPITVDEDLLEALNRLVGTKEGLTRTRAALERMRGHGAMVRETLASLGLPGDLAAVPLVESGYDGDAASERAAGLWQFTRGTAEQYGLHVGEDRDERFDPRRATEAAARLLHDLHRQFGDWSLALAAYYQGGNSITRAIAQAGTRDAAELRARGLLARYQPGVMAAMLVLRDPSMAE